MWRNRNSAGSRCGVCGRNGLRNSFWFLVSGFKIRLKATVKAVHGRKNQFSVTGSRFSVFSSRLLILVKIKVAWIGRTKDAAIQSLSDEYLRRLVRYADVEGVALKDEAAILKMCARDARLRHTLVLLDSRGKQLSSEELAKFVGDYQDRNPLPLLFAVGGADGFSDQARQAATLVLSLGKMTLAHELARVVLLEQLYRAFTILKGHPYHLGH